MKENASWYFYQSDAYGRDLNEKEFKLDHIDFFLIPNSINFKLRTIYPGMVIGAGYTHPAILEINKGENEIGDFQMGFYFDHTTGLPVIPGSSVKGVLKNAFPKKMNDVDPENKGKKKYIFEKYEKYHINIEINPYDSKGNFFPDIIFHDAYITRIPSNDHIFADDYLTPHHNNPFMEPTPLRFLKIAPDIEFTFQFGFKKKEMNEKIIHVFKEILMDFGIGAKRNYGYGMLRES